LRRLLLAAAFLAVALPAAARPVVVELFTSEACSSCPPADDLLASLQARDPGILLLSLHVTYWNGPAWTDRFALTAATERQAWYAGLAHSQNVYTPEAVVDGGAQLVGSDRAGLTAAIAAAKAAAGAPVPVSVQGGAMIKVTVGAASAEGSGDIWLFGYDPLHVTQVGGGENGGARLTEVNVVRSMADLGTWLGGFQSFSIPRPAGTKLAVVLQAANGAIEGAATD